MILVCRLVIGAGTIAVLGTAGLMVAPAGAKPTFNQMCAVPTGQIAPGTIRVTFFGVSGFMIESGHRPLLTAPFFSNPSFGESRPRALRLFARTPPPVVSNT